MFAAHPELGVFCNLSISILLQNLHNFGNQWFFGTCHNYLPGQPFVSILRVTTLFWDASKNDLETMYCKTPLFVLEILVNLFVLGLFVGLFVLNSVFSENKYVARSR